MCELGRRLIPKEAKLSQCSVDMQSEQEGKTVLEIKKMGHINASLRSPSMAQEKDRPRAEACDTLPLEGWAEDDEVAKGNEKG